MNTLLRDARCAGCTSHCAGEPIRCQQAATDWLIQTITAFGGSLNTALTVASLWTADSSVSPTDPPLRERPRQRPYGKRVKT